DDRAAPGTVAPRGAAATGRDPPPAARVHPRRTRRAVLTRDARPSSPPARYLWPLSAAHRDDSSLAGAAAGRGGRARIGLVSFGQRTSVTAESQPSAG